MKLTITGVHMDVGAALKTHTEEKLQDLKKHFEHVIDVHVAYSHIDGQRHHADVTIHANGINLRAEGRGSDAYTALDDANKKLTKQLDKYKGRLQKHRHRREKFAEQIAAIAPLKFEDATVEESHLDGMDADAFAEFAPDVVKKEVGQIVPMSVDEAVMQMDLLHKPAFLFLNAKSGKLNMVYREGDSTVRWVTPS